MVVWIAGCAFVDLVVPDIANAWKMAIGYVVGTLGVLVTDHIGRPE